MRMRMRGEGVLGYLRAGPMDVLPFPGFCPTCLESIMSPKKRSDIPDKVRTRSVGLGFRVGSPENFNISRMCCLERTCLKHYVRLIAATVCTLDTLNLA